MRPETPEEWLWICKGTYPELGGRDDYCAKAKPINGLCGQAHPICAAGTSEVIAGNTINWWCRGLLG